MMNDSDQAGTDRCRKSRREVVREKLLRLSVNGREMLTLVASPHDPEVLIIGFLHLQGIITDLADIVSLGVCPDSGQAAVVIRQELPDRLMPTLTSGCGGGIVFEGALEKSPAKSGVVTPPDDLAGTISNGMRALFTAAEHYAVHGGIHSAAICDTSGLLLHAEDIGRHNTIDRLAGAALRQGLDLAGKVLLTSGRISSEMALKAARLGVAALASRTSPTDLAVEICEGQAIGLAGYVRGDGMEIFACPELFQNKSTTLKEG